MSVGDYLNLQNQLAGSIPEQVPQLYDEQNDKAVYAKSVLEAGGNVLGVSALTTGIKKLKNSKGLLEKLNLSPEELDGMAQDLNSGNYKEVLAKISKKAINKASARLQGAVQKARGIKLQDGDLAEDVVATPAKGEISNPAFQGLNNSEEIQLARNVPKVSQESATRFRVPKRKLKAPQDDESGGLKGDPNVGKLEGEGQFDGVTGDRLAGTEAERLAPRITDMFDDLSGAYRPVMTIRVLPTNTTGFMGRAVRANINPETPKPTADPLPPKDPVPIEKPLNPEELNNAVKAVDNPTTTDAENLTGQVAKGVVDKGAGEAKQILGDLIKGNEADDDNPIGLAITAALGIGSLIAGGLTKTHHEAFMKPPAGPIAGFASQIGAGL